MRSTRNWRKKKKKGEGTSSGSASGKGRRGLRKKKSKSPPKKKKRGRGTAKLSIAHTGPEKIGRKFKGGEGAAVAILNLRAPHGRERKGKKKGK